MLTARTASALALAMLCPAAAAVAAAPDADAGMRIGNYELRSDRWNDVAWVWLVNFSCNTADPRCATPYSNPMVATPTEDLNVTGVPRPSRNGAGFQNTAFHAAGRYTLTVDVIDGVRCFGYNLPSHDVYDWDATSLSGTITSTFDAGCAGAPGGTNVYLFSLNPM